MQKTYAVLLMLAYLPGALADDFKVIKLEQDMRNLERQVQELSRQLKDLQQRSNRTVDQRNTAPSPGASSTPSADWLNARRWNQVRAGMTEMEVIQLLGPPTSLRGATDAESRTLLYAMEIGSSGFLSGSVQLKDRRVVEVRVPVLK